MGEILKRHGLVRKKRRRAEPIFARLIRRLRQPAHSSGARRIRSCPKHLQAFGVFQELLGHEEITTTEIYLHVAVGTNGLGVESPLDGLEAEEWKAARNVECSTSRPERSKLSVGC